MRKKNALCAVNLLIFGCLLAHCSSNTGPRVTSVSFSGGVVNITLSETNSTVKETMKSKMTINEGGFTGPAVDFDVVAVPAAPFKSKNYQLNSFNPALKTGTDYYLNVRKGTFRTEDTDFFITSVSGTDIEENGVFKFSP